MADEKHWVYRIVVDDVTRYVGITKRWEARQREHNIALQDGTDRLIYNFLRREGVTQIVLLPIREFSNRTDAKRYEAMLIFQDYFTYQNLYQKPPNVSDR